MNKKETIKLLHEEVGLLHETYADEPVLTELQFKEADEILSELKRKKEQAGKWVEKLKSIVEGDDRFLVLTKEPVAWRNKEIYIPLPLILIDGQTLISNCVINGTEGEALWGEEL